MPPRLAIVVPCYNEQDVLPSTLRTLTALLLRMDTDALVASDSYILCVDDGSQDDTWPVICSAHNENRLIKGISFAHNAGHQNALIAGLDTVVDRCDCAVTIDADLQDDPEAIIKMVKEFRLGKELVFGVRSSRDSDTWFKRTSSRSFYKIQKMLGVDTVYDHADFRLMSNRAIHMLGEYGESNMYLRGIVARIGLSSSIVTYPRSARVAGETKYPLSKMLSLSIDGITSFTAKPMRYIFYLGFIFLIIDVIVALWALLSYIGGHTASGWTSLILSVWFLGSLILMSIGVVGEYIGKIFVEVKHRPRYAIREELF